ncbi:MAG TPA: TMEM175 family protein [Thermoanaerobaculia bacterium]|nr:TMEM175 family protein [Thermoanaerobaculia bacterium]
MPELTFRNRAHEVTRLEAFSDIVFGFALTLIVVALEVPESFEELMRSMRGFLGFAICFAVLMWVWHAHYLFFRRYGLTDGYTIVLNTILLFLVLYYVYPLKFLFSLVTGAAHNHNITHDDVSTLFIIYGLGFTGIWSLFALLHLHAFRRRDELALTPLEVSDTRGYLAMYSSYAAIGVVSLLIAVTTRDAALSFAGWVYFLIGPVSWFIGAKMGRAREKLRIEN